MITALCSAGLALVPIPSASKAPRATGWNLPRSATNPNGYSSNAADFANCHGFNFGLYHGASNTLAFDLDDVNQTKALFDNVAGLDLSDWLNDPARFEIKSPKANRGKLLFKLPVGFDAATPRQLKHDKRVIFELRAGNCQDVIHGQHPEGGEYRLIGNPAAIPEAPVILLDMLKSWDNWLPCLDSAQGIQPPPKIAQRPPKEKQPGSRDPVQEFNLSMSVADVLVYFANYAPAGRDRFIRPGSESNAPGAVILRGCADGIERVFSHGGDTLNDGFAHDAFDCYRLLLCGGDWATALNWNPEITKHNQRLYRKAQDINPFVGSPVPAVIPKLSSGVFSFDPRNGTATTHPLTEFGNACRLYDSHGVCLRYVYDAKAWLHWQGGAWSWGFDGATVRSLAAGLPQQIYDEGSGDMVTGESFAKWARQSQSEKTIKAAVSLLQDFEPLRCPLATVDADPFLVGLDNARQVLDLKTGTARPATQSDLITKTLIVKQLGDSNKAERWLIFLSQVFGNDPQLIDWLKRWCGYLLTGSTQEQIFVFFFGLGANGKSVLADTIRFILGDYVRTLAAETLTESRRQAGSATPDLAELIGARLAISSETEDGAALAESLIKNLSAGDTMTVRKLYTGPVQFTPQFKLMMLGNHKPVIRGNDYGIWRRVRLIPFKRTFTEGERDPALLAKLKVEAPHILAWMVDGCLDWRRRGLADVPASIKQATGDYQEEQDLIGSWLAECCKQSPNFKTSATDLYRSYSQWCIANGLRPCSKNSLGRQLSERGFNQHKSNGQRLWIGVQPDLSKLGFGVQGG